MTTGRWGYKQSMNILDENAIVNLMYTDLVKGALTNLEVAHSMSDGTALIQEHSCSHSTKMLRTLTDLQHRSKHG